MSFKSSKFLAAMFCLWLLCNISDVRADTVVERIETDLLVVGGTESGWAAAIQAARLGVPSITIVHDGQWLGGQFTEQALACVDENKGVGKVGWGVNWHPMKRSFARSGLFKELMDKIEAYNTQKYGSPMPGKPYHGPSTFRPVEAEAVFRQMLQPYIDSGQVAFYKNRYPVKADVVAGPRGGKRLTGVSFAKLESDSKLAGAKADLHVKAKLTIDASDWGDVIQVAGVDFECGPDAQARYGEASAPIDLSKNPPNEMNPITWAMIVVESDGDSPIPKPARFDDRNYSRATFQSLNEFRNLKWDKPNPGLGAISHWPDKGKASSRQLSVYNVRRIVDGYASKTKRTMILLNYMNGQDYPLERLPQPVVDQLEANEKGASTKNIVRMTRQQRDIVFQDAKNHAKGVLYHLQNFVHDRATDKTNSFRRFHLSEEFGTADNLPPKPYIRESLRLKAMYVMREQDGRNRDGETKTSATERFAHVMYPDGLFAWQFHYDFHRTGRTYLTDEGASGPWIDYHKTNRHTKFLSDRCTFPLRSLIPARMDGLIGAQKNVGYSSIVSAAIRLHDQCIAVGQAAGAIAVVSLRTGEQPREFAYNRSHLESVRHALCGEAINSVPLQIWPFRDISPDQKSYVAINRLAAIGALPLRSREIDFKPDQPATVQWRVQVVERTDREFAISSQTKLPSGELTRGEFCVKWWNEIKDFPTREFVRKSSTDADADGIKDEDDALLFTPNDPIRFEIDVTVLTPATDGIPPAKTDALHAINFCGSHAPMVKGFTNDNGNVYSDKRGFGWSRSLSTNHRRRMAVKEVVRDTFLFTRTRDKWECQVENGRYHVVICVGDSGHEQLLQRVSTEGHLVVDNVTTARGEFAERAIEVDVSDGRLTMEIGSEKPMSNTCVNWIMIRRASVKPSETKRQK
ncbi:MAG: hypothetical protein ACI9G1_003060 [Pirellulaceae bacterium]|jgi:hypothetical protein